MQHEKTKAQSAPDVTRGHGHPLSLIVVDDEEAQRTILGGYLKKGGHSVRLAGSAKEALAFIRAAPADLVLTDFRMPDRNGFDLLADIRETSPETDVVIMTAFGTIEGAVRSIRAGAYDYLTKPVDLEELDLLVQRVGERRNLISENRLLREQLSEKYSFTGIIAQSPEMESVLQTAGRVAKSKATVLIRGESGTGKEILARAIHFAGARSDRPFIAVNCAALNENLLESELFGHERGAFTGAEQRRRGRFELADQGTIFLDEIGDLPPSTQVKLLRVLQEHQFERVGGSEVLQVDVRILAATNRNLEELLRTGQFREDLFYRLNVVTIEIPPLRKRRADIAPTLEHFLHHYSEEQQRSGLSFSREAWDLLLRYDYPGNVRELENIVQRAIILARGNQITTAELPQVVKALTHEQSGGAAHTLSLPVRVERLEKELVLDALRQSGGNQSQAAAGLGISERNLRYRLKKWGIK